MVFGVALRNSGDIRPNTGRGLFEIAAFYGVKIGTETGRVEAPGGKSNPPLADSNRDRELNCLHVRPNRIGTGRLGQFRIGHLGI